MATLNVIAGEIAQELNIPKGWAQDVAALLFERIIEDVAAGDTVTIWRVGSFKRVRQKKRKMRNPQTQAMMTVPARWKIRWRASSLLGARLNGAVRAKNRRRA